MHKRTSEEVRQDVAKAYTGAVQRPSAGCCDTSEPKGVTAQLAGYDMAKLAGLPNDAVENSFGCGNPVAFSGVKEGDVVLDLGSGAGIDLLIAAERVGSTGRVIGVDMTDEMIARARANISRAGVTTVEVRKGIIEELPVENESVDWVISNCVINLSPEKERVFSEIARVLKPGGQMLVSDIVVDEMPEWIEENISLYSSCVAGAISEDAYLAGLKQAGLEEVEVKHRLVYATEQLCGLAESEIDGGGGNGCCGPVDQIPAHQKELAAKAADALTGKVASIGVYGKKAG